MMQSHHKPRPTGSFRFTPPQARFRGSLPLKKRRFHQIIATDDLHESSIHYLPQCSSAEPIISFSTSSTNVDKINTDTASHQYTDENLAALALVAAATASENVSILSSKACDMRLSQAVTLNDAPRRADTCQNQQLVQEKIKIISKSPEDFSHLMQDTDMSTDAAAQTMKEVRYMEKYSAGTEEISTRAIPMTQSRPRVHHPPLAAPIPGGCHGRTSRNNSYCRRTPCYNGSNYCKLHYQQYVVQVGADPNGPSSSASRINFVKLDAPKVKLDGKRHSSPSQRGTVAIEGAENATSNYRNHQDKRYTGLCADERQCFATTTRGRPCAYVAVAGMKYCHLHADYDTNPPPRRGGCSSNKSKTATELTKLESRVAALDNAHPIKSMEGKCDQSGTPLTGQYKVNNSANAVRVADEMGCKISSTSSNVSSAYLEPSHNVTTNLTAERIPATSKSILDLKELLSPSSNAISTPNPVPYPLLNTIPSDKWSQRLVLISTGPLMNHVGRVVKWGNGWITVSMQTGVDGMNSVCSVSSSGELLHNRRAIELYLLPEDCARFPLEDLKSLQNYISATSLSVYKLPMHPISTQNTNTEEASKLLEKKQHERGHNPHSDIIGEQIRVCKRENSPSKDAIQTTPACGLLEMAKPAIKCIDSSFERSGNTDDVEVAVSKVTDATLSPVGKKHVNEPTAMSETNENSTNCKLVVSMNVVVDDSSVVKSLQLVEPILKEAKVRDICPHASTSETLVRANVKDDGYCDNNCLPLVEIPPSSKNGHVVFRADR